MSTSLRRNRQTRTCTGGLVHSLSDRGKRCPPVSCGPCAFFYQCLPDSRKTGPTRHVRPLPTSAALPPPTAHPCLRVSSAPSLLLPWPSPQVRAASSSLRWARARAGPSGSLLCSPRHPQASPRPTWASVSHLGGAGSEPGLRRPRWVMGAAQPPSGLPSRLLPLMPCPAERPQTGVCCLRP